MKRIILSLLLAVNCTKAIEINMNYVPAIAGAIIGGAIAYKTSPTTEQDTKNFLIRLLYTNHAQFDITQLNTPEAQQRITRLTNLSYVLETTCGALAGALLLGVSYNLLKK